MLAMTIDQQIAAAERRLRETTNRRAGQVLRRLVECLRADAQAQDEELRALSIVLRADVAHRERLALTGAGW